MVSGGARIGTPHQFPQNTEEQAKHLGSSRQQNGRARYWRCSNSGSKTGAASPRPRGAEQHGRCFERVYALDSDGPKTRVRRAGPAGPLSRAEEQEKVYGSAQRPGEALETLFVEGCAVLRCLFAVQQSNAEVETGWGPVVASAPIVLFFVRFRLFFEMVFSGSLCLNLPFFLSSRGKARFVVALSRGHYEW